MVTLSQKFKPGGENRLNVLFLGHEKFALISTEVKTIFKDV